MLNALSSYISPREQLITIEDAAELQLQQPHVACRETRPPSVEGTPRDPSTRTPQERLADAPRSDHRGECRGEEAFVLIDRLVNFKV